MVWNNFIERVKSVGSKFPVPADEFPVPLCREFSRKVLELLLELMRTSAKRAENFANSLIFSLFSVRHRALADLQGTKLLLLCCRVGGIKGR